MSAMAGDGGDGGGEGAPGATAAGNTSCETKKKGMEDSEQDAAGSTFRAGQVVVLTGLVSKPSLNGRRGLVRKVLPQNSELQIDLAQGGGRAAGPHDGLLAVPAQNLGLAPTAGEWDALEVWPRPAAELVGPADIPITPIENWPADWTQEDAFLRSSRGWKDPSVPVGFASAEAPKPDFMMYFDNGDTSGPVNGIGNLILAGVPSYKLAGVNYSNIRGRIVVVYSPTTMGGRASLQYSPHGLEGTKFSVERLQQILHFFTDAEAAQGKARHMDSVTGKFMF
jgi:hypothetical protein